MLLWGLVATGGAPWVMAGAGWAMVCTALFTNIIRDKELSLHDAFHCILNYLSQLYNRFKWTGTKFKRWWISLLDPLAGLVLTQAW